jgi:hypothetical protein
MKTRFGFLFLLSFIFYLSSAQVPQGFNYQAIARDGTGNVLANTSLQAMFYIRSASSGGTLFWQEWHTGITTNSFGLFSLTIGTGAKQAGTAATFDLIDWTVSTKYLVTEIYYSGSWKPMGSAQLYTVPYAMAAKSLVGAGKLGITGTTDNLEEAIFEVKNKGGQTVLAVYNEGVRIYVDDGNKGSKGGFAVGGFGTDKAASQRYLYINADSTRVYVDEAVKGTKGGFAVGGFDASKGSMTGNYMNMTPDNYLIGAGSGKALNGGLYNSFFGYHTGLKTVTGSNNVLLGYQAGEENLASNNVFLGYQAGIANTSGLNNIFIGYQAGFGNTSGNYNTLMGYQAGYSSGLASYITAIGYMAGYSLSDWQAGTYVGYRAGQYNTGRTNVMIGSTAGYTVSTGQDNVFIGGGAGGDYDASTDRFTGNSNVMIGKYSGFRFFGGSYNVYLGASAGSDATGSGNIFIGPSAGQNNTGSNLLIIDNAGGGSNSALIYGDFNSDLLRFNASVGINAAPGAAKLNVVDNTTTIAVRGETSWSGSTDHYGVYGFGAGSSSWNHGVYGYASGGYQAFGVWGIASGASGYNVGVYGTASGAGNAAGYFAGPVTVTGTFTNPSDRNLKKDIKPLSGALDKILKVQGVSYLWKSEQELEDLLPNKSSDGKMGVHEKFNFPEGKQIGVIAQDVEQVLPELVQTDADGIKSVDYIKIIPVLVEAIKEQQKMIDRMQAEIDQIKNK